MLDLSCRQKDGKYYVVTDRWQVRWGGDRGWENTLFSFGWLLSFMIFLSPSPHSALQRFSTLALSEQSVEELSRSCDELLVHGVDVEVRERGAGSI